uniref:Uncharacterized protein n=1 Tax=Anguilla anguilla TaxID=7936 RepID=A0A0E9TJ55_ANGAN
MVNGNVNNLRSHMHSFKYNMHRQWYFSACLVNIIAFRFNK